MTSYRVVKNTVFFLYLINSVYICDVHKTKIMKTAQEKILAEIDYYQSKLEEQRELRKNFKTSKELDSVDYLTCINLIKHYKGVIYGLNLALDIIQEDLC